ncbi:hypothetical protein QTJ16_002420 [Diplocarpon rosae]|uniref:Uncharacterized protein n=1 Tax=Diplocarpon rosae TaxID=946125 RepID=A0AAD9T3A5_9HELO|nr:hypothetical protein QTJ16_002420 [Diplocarpon rosae]
MPLALPPALNIPFLIHVFLETPASLNFFFRPNNQLSSPAPQAHALIKQYAVLLLSSSLIALVFAFREADDTSRRVAGALAVYHVAPLMRAVERIGAGVEGKKEREREALRGVGGRGKAEGDLGGPWVHAVMHASALGALMWEFGCGGK